MLTSFQASPIAYWADTVPDVTQGEGPYCSECADALAGDAVESGDHDELFIHYYNTPAGFQPASRYGMEDAYPEGIDCIRCGAEIVEPGEDYCSEHGGERSYNADGTPAQSCEYGEEPNLAGDGERCRFPSTDPNPPIPRWVPCGSCGARDGEPHRDGCSTLEPERPAPRGSDGYNPPNIPAYGTSE